MHLFRRVVAVTAAALLAACATAATPAAPAAASGIGVTVVTVNGTGCPAGTVTATVAPDGSSVTAAYSAFTAANARRNCVFSIAIVAPGQTWAVTSVTEHGAVSLPAGATATQDTGYYIQGSSPTNHVIHTASGPLAGPWDQSDPAPLSAPCGTTRNLNIDVSLRTVGAGASLSLNGATPGTTINLGFTDCP